VSAPTAATPPVTSLLTGLKSYWPFDEVSGASDASDVHDAQPLAANGTISATAGKLSNARVVDGVTTEYLSRSTSAFNFPGVAHSVACWVRPLSLTGAESTWGR
jgi:hypothetical protein